MITKKLLLGFILPLFVFFTTLSAFAQTTVISQFNWDSNPPTQSVVGPNAIAISGSSTSDANGVGATNGLNAGTPKADINMDVPGSPTFDVPGIDISIDFRRDENRGDLVSRNGFAFGMTGANLSVTFTIEDGMGGTMTVNSGNIYNIPNDNTYRTYRFFYAPDLGVAEIRVDGVTQWTYNGSTNRNMVWTGDNLRVGNAMDGSGNNNTFMDNLVIASITDSPLPVKLISFDAEAKDTKVQLNWTTASESNNDYFLVQRSRDGKDFETIDRLEGVGNSSSLSEYDALDKNPFIGLSYYRIKQVDYNGEYELYPAQSVNFRGRENIQVYPNPVRGDQIVKITGAQAIKKIKILDSRGRIIQSRQFQDNDRAAYELPLNQVNKGVYFLEIMSATGIQQKKIVVQ